MEKNNIPIIRIEEYLYSSDREYFCSQVRKDVTILRIDQHFYSQDGKIFRFIGTKSFLSLGNKHRQMSTSIKTTLCQCLSSCFTPLENLLSYATISNNLELTPPHFKYSRVKINHTNHEILNTDDRNIELGKRVSLTIWN